MVFKALASFYRCSSDDKSNLETFLPNNRVNRCEYSLCSENPASPPLLTAGDKETVVTFGISNCRESSLMMDSLSSAGRSLRFSSRYSSIFAADIEGLDLYILLISSVIVFRNPEL